MKVPIINNIFKGKVITECSELPYVFTLEIQQLAVLLIAGLATLSYISISTTKETLWALGKKFFHTKMTLYSHQALLQPSFGLINNNTSILGKTS